MLKQAFSEQIEEEALARTIMDKLRLIGNDKGGLYLFDRDISSMVVTSAAADNPIWLAVGNNK